MQLNDELEHVRTTLRAERPDLYRAVSPHHALTDALRDILPELDMSTAGAVLLGYGYLHAVALSDAPCMLSCHHGSSLLTIATGDVLMQDHELQQKL